MTSLGSFLPARLKRIAPYAALAVISAITYWRHLNFLTFVKSDWLYLSSQDIATAAKPSVWFSSHELGKAVITMWHYPFYLTYRAVTALLGGGSPVAEKFVVFWPIAFLLPIGAFLLVKRVTKSIWGGLVGALVFALNTYFLSIDSQGHQLITAAAAFLPLALWAYMAALERDSLRLAVTAGLLAAVCGFYDFRVAYQLCGVMLLYALFDRFIAKRQGAAARRTFLAAVPFGLFVLLNVFWVWPTATAGFLTHNRVLDRGLFGDQFWTLSAALTLSHPFWTGGAIEWFAAQPIAPLSWLVPLAAFFGLYLRRKDPRILFFGIVAVCGVFLAKQTHEPLAGVYRWLFQHVPGFSAFREATKFYVLIALGYAVLCGAFVASLADWKPPQAAARAVRLIAPALLAALFLWNARPLLNGEIGLMFQPQLRPPEYAAFDARLAAEPGFFRVVPVPRASAWHPIGTRQHPQISLYALRRVLWQPTGEALVPGAEPPGGEATLDDPQIPALLNLASVKYLFVPPVEPDGLFDATRDHVIATLDRQPYLRKIDLGTGSLVVYENRGYFPHLYLTRRPEASYPMPVSFVQLSGSHYSIELKDLSTPVYLHFSELFHPAWRLYAGRFTWLQALFTSRSLPAAWHGEELGKFNVYRLDPQALRDQLDPADYRRNPDGSIDVTLTLYFRPQAYFCLGAIVSSAALTAAIAYLVVTRKRRRT